MRPRTLHKEMRLPRGMYYRERTKSYYYYGKDPEGAEKPKFVPLGSDLTEARRQYGKVTANIIRPKRRLHRNLGDRNRSGVVYVVRAGDDGPVKIGFSGSEPGIYIRIADMQTGCPYRLRLIGFIDGTMGDEFDAHDALMAWHSCGEWFLPSPEVLAHVDRLLKIPSTSG